MKALGQKRLWATSIVAAAAIAGMAIWAVSASASNGPTFASGEGTVPADVVANAEGYINSHGCTSGGFDTVLQQGSTTTSNLKQLQPGGISDFVGSQLQATDRVYGVLLSGNCIFDNNGLQEKAQTAYALVTSGNDVIAWRLWDTDHTPTLSSPFGSAVAKALAS